MKIPEDEFRLQFFLDHDFVRKKCGVCGEFYWTLDRVRQDCGDSPCSSYGFLGNSPTKRRYSVSEMRESFLSFFEKRGHKRIEPYPVIARWREDLYVTIASIADFQPYVTEGLVPPPGNPLVISQPCLRFLDVDNVGVTAGRHLTIFEMAAHHAFNYPDRQIYWKDETVRLHHEFMTGELGVPPEKITYKEGVWEGGGNAGPDLEGCVEGLEVSTLVFMKYRTSGGTYEEMPLQIVDTGYGMERLTWLSQGSPTGFHAVYGPLLKRIMEISGLDVSENLIAVNTKYAVSIDSRTPAQRKSLRQKVAEETGISAKELEEKLTPLENAYAVLDHTKALIFMLAEGVVPSNVKAGYLTRLLIRRAYRLLRSLGIEKRLEEIAEMQLDHWSPDFPSLQEMRDEILASLSVEEVKYRDTLERGGRLIERLSGELRQRGDTLLPLDKLIELYESHGIPPEIASEGLRREEISVEIPESFYSLIAGRHEAPLKHRRDRQSDTFSDLPETNALYYDDAYLKAFSAKVIRSKGDEVILDRTAFYPEGGGQPPDSGRLEHDGKSVEVFDVQRLGNVVIHKVKGETIPEGSSVTGSIDWERRLSLMRSHTATHIVNGAARRVLGKHVWQTGAQKGVENSRLDISHWAKLSDDEINRIELLANEAVTRNLEVDVKWMKREEAEALHGFRLYQGGVVPARIIRVVSVGDWDVEACGGIYCRQTGEVGLIKIIKTERIQDGVERIVFSVGRYALAHVQREESELRKVAEILNVQVEDIAGSADSLRAKSLSASKELERLRSLIAETEADRLLEKAETIDGVKLSAVAIEDVDQRYMIDVSNSYVRKEKEGVIVLIGKSGSGRLVVSAGSEAIRRGVHAGMIAREAASQMGGGGSGDPSFGQGGGRDTEKVQDALRKVRETVAKQIMGAGNA